MEATSEFPVTFLLEPSQPGAHVSPRPPCVEGVASLDSGARKFERRLTSTIAQFSDATLPAELTSKVIVPVRVVCQDARDLTERTLARGVLEQWNPEERSIADVANRISKLFEDAVRLMNQAREKLLEFDDRDSAAVVARYMGSMHVRIALLRDVGSANEDGVRSAVERLCQEIEKSDVGVSTSEILTYLRLGEKLVSAVPKPPILPLSGKYRVFAAMSLVQNLTAWVSELAHEAGPFGEAIPVHKSFAESIYDTSACIAARADEALTTNPDGDAGEFEKQLKMETEAQLERLFQTYELLRQRCDPSAHDSEQQAERFLCQEIKDRAHAHLADAVQILRNVFQDQLDVIAATRNARVIVFQAGRYEEPELQWAAHILELNLVAYGNSPESALEELRGLVATDLEFRAECGLEPKREIGQDIEQKYLSMLDSGKPDALNWTFADRSIQLQVRTESSPSD